MYKDKERTNDKSMTKWCRGFELIYYPFLVPTIRVVSSTTIAEKKIQLDVSRSLHHRN